MSGGADNWLPIGVLESVPIRAAIGGAIDGWSRKWFAGARLSAIDIEAAAGAAPQPQGGWQLHRGVAIAVGGPETVCFAQLALGAGPERLVLSEVDQDIIGRFAVMIAADLAATVAQAFGISGPDSGEAASAEDPLDGRGGLLFAAADDRSSLPVVRGAIPMASLVPFCKSAMPPRQAKRAPAPGRLSRALGRTGIRIEARIGDAILPLGDLASLAPGDVLVLDRPIEDGIEIALAKGGGPFARGEMNPGAALRSLILSPQRRES